MNELSKLLQENLNIEFISATLSNPKNKDGVQKVKVRPILKKDVLYFQLESFRNNQAFHENVEEKKACEILLKYMENMRQMQMETQRAAYTILVSKKGKVTIKSKMKKGEKKQINMSHDRKKKYVLEEGVPVKLCRSCRADVLLLEVCPHPPRTLQDRLLLANDLRDVCPHCKTVLLVDEAEYPELATAVCLAKKDHIVDDFVYASVSPAYLSAMMDTL